MLRCFLSRKRWLCSQPLISALGLREIGCSRTSHFGPLNIHEFKGPFVSNYEGIYCRFEKVDPALVEVLRKVPRRSFIVADIQRPEGFKEDERNEIIYEKT